jgi:hypothetical protein
MAVVYESLTHIALKGHRTKYHMKYISMDWKQ